MFIPAKSTSLRNEVHFETMLFESIERPQISTTKRLFSHHLYRRDRAMQYFRYCILPKGFLTGGWIFKTRRLPVLDARECAYCVISDSAPRKKYSHARVYRIASWKASLKDGDKEK
ncbi:ANE_G0052330.mRNA.1.CDS.1 [Saccharomyces cerevisiae]|nr:ANE_G0052330.mRNA.1.CDS.1 [Saccharomyces cerevisiae]CAI6894232.1 ANE_G0052330.mRNA.1.CDS.1 [Saccharomyces cerevisiae]